MGYHQAHNPEASSAHDPKIFTFMHIKKLTFHYFFFSPEILVWQPCNLYTSSSLSTLPYMNYDLNLYRQIFPIIPMIFSKKTMYFHNLRYEKWINVNYQLTYTIGFKIIFFSVDNSNEKGKLWKRNYVFSNSPNAAWKNWQYSLYDF